MRPESASKKTALAGSMGHSVDASEEDTIIDKMQKSLVKGLSAFIILSVGHLIGGCTTSMIYGPSGGGHPPTSEALTDTPAAYLVSGIANAATVPSPEKERRQTGYKEARLQRDLERLSWYLAYVAQSGELPTEPQNSRIAARTLAWGYNCRDYSKDVMRDQIFMGPGQVLYEFASLETSGGRPQVRRSDCKPNSFVAEYNRIDDYTEVPLISQDDWIAAAETAGFTCGVSEPSVCHVDFSVLTTYASEGSPRKLSVRRGRAAITFITDALPMIRFERDEQRSFDPDKRPDAESFWRGDA